MSDDRPIGIFDSGVGGLTVARAVLDQLPHEPVLYVGDTARGPYGPLPIAEVRAYALDVMDHLVDADVKMLVIACNSASAAVLRDARERYDIPRGRGCASGSAAGGAGHPVRSHWSDWHPRHDHLPRVRRRLCCSTAIGGHE